MKLLIIQKTKRNNMLALQTYSQKQYQVKTINNKKLFLHHKKEIQVKLIVSMLIIK